MNDQHIINGTEQSAITSPGVMQAIAERRSVRAYKPDLVSRATIVALLEAAVKAPTAMHEEPWAFAVIQDRHVLRELSSAAHATMDLVRRGHLNEFFKQDVDIFYDAGTLIAICGQPTSAFVAADCWLAAENLMLAAHAMGLGSCVIGMALQILNRPEWKARLGIAPEMEVFVPLVVGVPANTIPAVSRKEPRIIAWK